MKLDKHDIAMAKVVTKLDRPVLGNVLYDKGRFVVVDGYMIIIRHADREVSDGDHRALIPAKILKSVKADNLNRPTLQIADDGHICIAYNDRLYRPQKHSPQLVFEAFGDGEYPKYTELIPKDNGKKKAQVCLNVGLLKRLLSVMPDDGHLRLGIDEPSHPVEFQIENTDRPFHGVIMPVFVDWDSHQWTRYTEE